MKYDILSIYIRRHGLVISDNEAPGDISSHLIKIHGRISFVFRIEENALIAYVAWTWQ